MNCCGGQEIISVANWTADGAVRLEHCRSATFLMSVHTASLTGVLSSDNCSGVAGILVSQGPVTLRLSAKLIGLFRFQVCRFWMLKNSLFSLTSLFGTWPTPRKCCLQQDQCAASQAWPTAISHLVFLQMMAMAVLWVRYNCTITRFHSRKA